MQCVVGGMFHVPHELQCSPSEYLNSLGLLRTAPQTCNIVSWSCLVDVYHLSPSIEGDE